MRIISKKRLREFWAAHPDAEGPLTSWYKVVSAAVWHNFAEVRATYNTADLVGNCTVFDVRGNNYRLIARVFFATDVRPGVVYVLRVMTHPEYDENKWPGQCGCHNPPPAVKPAKTEPKKSQTKGKAARPTRRPKRRWK